MASALDQFNQTQAAQNAQALQNATIQDVAKKYGFDFSRDYAGQQAEVMAQAGRNAQEAARRENESLNQMNKQRITDDYRSAASSLDKGYFQQFLGTQQNQVNRGLNAGLAADQNLRLAMNKQGEVANLWRVRNQANQEEASRYGNTSQKITEAMALIEQERIANEARLYQELLARGYDVLSSDRNYGLQLGNSAWGQHMDSLNYALRQAELAKASKGGGGGGGSYANTTGKPTPLGQQIGEDTGFWQNEFEKFMAPKPFKQAAAVQLPGLPKGVRPIF